MDDKEINRMTQEWRDISGYEGKYQVSDQGDIRSLDRTSPHAWGGKVFRKGIVLKHRHNGCGYRMATLCDGRTKKNKSVHRLVALAFVDGKSREKNQVNHIDGNKSNNISSNLEWVTPKGNVEHAISKGSFDNRGEKSKNSVLNDWKVRVIRRLCEQGYLGQSEIAKMFSISRPNVSMIHTRKSWNHI